MRWNTGWRRGQGLYAKAFGTGETTGYNQLDQQRTGCLPILLAGSELMSDVKQQVRDLLERLPDDCSVEDVQYQLYVAQTIQHRLELTDRSEPVPQAEAETRLDKWRIK